MGSVRNLPVMVWWGEKLKEAGDLRRESVCREQRGFVKRRIL